MTVQNPHDRFFRDSFGRPEIARNYLEEYLPAEVIRGEIWLRVSLATLRAIFDPQLRDGLGDLLALIFQLAGKRTGLEYIRTILYYLSKATERVSREDLQTALLHQGAQGESVMATIAQEFIQQGIEQGKLEEKWNIARQLLRLHGPVTVSEITGLTIEEVKALQEDVQSGEL
ncbi:MAG: hypothetical protein GY803_12060 [Chloroflexi bacterium]|nr:hypothetical protein [Chloroflexota bacterium]